ncbi:MAG: MFS transporter [Dehalococcoidales bacterium]|nr:MFS transporter [Dehalococcoidales bacterium]
MTLSSPRRDQHTGIFYGYIIVVASILIMFLIHGPASTFGVFFKSLQTEFGLSRTVLSGATALGSIMWGIMAIVAGKLTDRFGPKLVIMTFCFMTSLGYILMSRIDSAWQIYLFLGVFVSFGNGSADVVLLSTTARWFTKRRGAMSGIVKVGTGAGLMIFPPVIAQLIQDLDWRKAYLVMGIASLFGVFFIAQILKRDPSQKGLLPYGADEVTAQTPSQPVTGLSMKQASVTRQFWLVGALFFLCIGAMQTVIVHVVPNAMDQGLPAAQAAGILSVIGAVSIFSRMAVGALGDRIGHRRIMRLNLLILVIALALLLFADTLQTLYLFAFIYGFAHGSFYTTISPMIAEIFGMRAHGALLGMFIFMGWLGHAAGPLFAGRVFDVTGSYHPAFITILAACAVGLALSTFLKPASQKK